MSDFMNTPYSERGAVIPDWLLADMQCVTPFEQGIQRPGKISYGVTSYGYDIRLNNKFKIFTNTFGAIIDPKAFDPNAFVEHEGDYCVIPPNSFILAESIETIKVPREILIICIGKSTYARCGLIVNVTPLEPEWHGVITLEISNTTPLPAKVYAHEGIAQLVFLKGLSTCKVSYADKKGKYQGQTETTLPRVDN